MKLFFSILFVLISLLFAGFDYENETDLDHTSVHKALSQLGDQPNPNILNASIEGVSAQRGRELVFHGFTTSENGRKTRRQSKYFTCTACHNSIKEDHDLTVIDPQQRLEYLASIDKPFLPGSTFYGIVNRTSFYNDDYVKKYGELTLEARNDIRHSIQLCATECAQGRALEAWEIESILAYFWTIGLKLGDLNLSETEKTQISTALANDTEDKKIVDLIKSKYLDHSPAHFEKPIVTQEERFDFDGDPHNGKLIYEISCQYCHYDNQYSFRELDNDKRTFTKLEKDFHEYHKYSVYEVTRWGTQPLIGKKAYMPFYTKEKMTNQQIKDLTTYIHYMAEGKSFE